MAPRTKETVREGGKLTDHIPYVAHELALAMLSDMAAGQGTTLDDGSKVIRLTSDLTGPDGLMASLSLELTMKQTS